MVALLALGLSFAVVGCGQKTEEETTSTPPTETMSPDTSMMMDTTMADTTMSH